MATNPAIDVTEAPLVRVPFESLKRAAKDRKSLVDEVAEGIAALAGGPKLQPTGRQASGEASVSQKQAADGDKAMTDAAAPADPDADAAAGPGPQSRGDQIAELTRLLSQLQGVKRKLREVSKAEHDDCQRCKARLEHLAALGVPARDAVLPWTKQRLNRILVDHLLREGCYETADRLVQTAGLANLTDAQVFQDARRVVEALRSHSTAAVGGWGGTPGIGAVCVWGGGGVWGRHAPCMTECKQVLREVVGRYMAF